MFNLFKPFDIFTIKSSGIVAYNPLINYDWSTTTTNGLRYLKDVGSTPTYNASMYFGRGAYLNGVDQSIAHDAISSSDIVAYSFCGKQMFTSNRYNLWTTGIGIAYYLALNLEYKNIPYAFNSNYNYVLNLTKNSIKLYENGVLVLNITTTDILYGTSKTIGRRGRSYFTASYLKDFYIFDRNLTEIEITQAYEQPELFYAMAQADSTCLLIMLMCEISSTARNYKTGINYPITNYTSSVRDNAKNLRYGLQTCKFVRDSLGVIQSASDYLECDGVGYAIIPSHTDTVNIKMTVNPTSLSGNLLSGGVTKTLTGLTLNVDNNVAISNVTPTEAITLASGFSGTIKIYTEELA